MAASHASLRDDYQVSCVELDILVELALAHPSCRGARLTGAGFGGCTVNLVERDTADEFAQTLSKGYTAETGMQPEIYITYASNGAELLR